VLERRLVRSIASKTNVEVSANVLDHNRGAIECNTALLSIRMGVLARNCICIERRHANNVGIGSSTLDRKYCAQSHYHRLIFQKLNKLGKQLNKHYSNFFKKISLYKNT
jgi:hypothetical protein